MGQVHAAKAASDALLAEIAGLERELALMQCAAEEEPIDEARWRSRDLGLLQGCWQLDSEYTMKAVQTDEVVTVASWEACFDDVGLGSQSLTFTDGIRCEGPLSAEFDDDGLLHLRDVRDVPCSRGVRIVAREVACVLAEGGQADCLSGDAGEPPQTPVILKR